MLAVNQYVVLIHVVPHLADYDVLQYLTAAVDRLDLVIIMIAHKSAFSPVCSLFTFLDNQSSLQKLEP